MGRDEQDELTGVLLGDSIRCCGLEPWEFTKTGDTTDRECFGSAEATDHERGFAVANGDVGDELTISEDGDAVDSASSQGFNLQVKVHGDAT